MANWENVAVLLNLSTLPLLAANLLGFWRRETIVSLQDSKTS